MAADYYLQLDGVKGESADSKHVGWIECTSIS
jgi:type VI secretion system secreted protein Hcp